MATSSSTSTSTATASCSSGRLGSASPSTSVICQEVFDETCQPSAEEINEYALLLGIDPVKESHLLFLAKEGLMQALPRDWKICYSEEKCGHYYFNTKTKQSQWDHPLDAVYRELVEQARQKQSNNIAATPITIDNSDDASQLDSGIRSLQGNDFDFDTANNTNDTSSPVGGINSNMPPLSGASSVHCTKSIGSAANSLAGLSSKNTIGFSGGVSRFLESRSKNFISNFQPPKNGRFEVARTNAQVGLALINAGGDNQGQKKLSTPMMESSVASSDATDGTVADRKEGFTLSGTGAMFLKSRRQIEVGLSQATAIMTNAVHNSNNTGPFAEIAMIPGTPPGVKSILRDSSLTDVRRRFERDENIEQASNHGAAAEDKKSVRFNLDETRTRGSPEDDGSSSRRLTQSPEVSINSDDDADPGEDPWDDDDDDDIVGKFNPDGSFQRSHNPFLINDEKHVREIKVIAVPKSQTIKMLQAQSFSTDLPERDRIKLNETSRSQSVEVHGVVGLNNNLSAASYLEKLKGNHTVKPLYEDTTDSESKGSSVRSLTVNKQNDHSTNQAINLQSNNPFEKHTSNASSGEKHGLRSLKVASKLVGFLKKDTEKPINESTARDSEEDSSKIKMKEIKSNHAFLKEERERLEDLLQGEIDLIKREHEQKLENIRQEYDLRLSSQEHHLEEAMNNSLKEFRSQKEEELDAKRRAVIEGHKSEMATLQKNHNEILQDLERDLKSEEELIKKEHAKKLAEVRDKLTHELEMERHRMRESGEDRLYEKVRCEKRLLEDKYRCLKEKYVRLKTDVKLSLERRNRRREAQAMNQQQNFHTTTTGSETERSISNKPSIGNSENRSLSLSTSCQDRGLATSSVGVSSNRGVKPPIPPKTHITGTGAAKASQYQRQQQLYEKPSEYGQAQVINRKPAVASKFIKHLQVQDDTTSISQSDTTISNNYSKGRYLPAPLLSDNGNSDSEAFQCNQENNNNPRPGQQIQRKKLFSRTKSASTSRLNSDIYKGDRPCTPVENLRHQLQKLEDLEDQFPENTLDTTYHLRYPFSDISNDRAGGKTPGASSELEFFKHRIHLERDSVRRAKESLRTQRTTFRARQREIKQRHKVSVTRHTLDQLIQEEKELTEMEVNLHRTRALLGEKVIRLRHLEQSLLRIYEKDKPSGDLLGIEHKEDATLSDLSSHSSSGFSSTDFASGCCADTQNFNKRKDTYHQESTECIQNLEILNAEIREILDILGKNQSLHPHGGMSVPLVSPSELNWSHMLSVNTNVPGASPSHVNSSLSHAAIASPSLMHQQHHAPQSIPTLADRLETYRQMASGRMQSSLIAANTIVSQSPRAVNYTTSLVERTRDLRNWLRQAKNEHDMLAGMSASIAQQHGLAGGGVSLASVLSGSSGNNIVSGSVIGAHSATQSNL